MIVPIFMPMRLIDPPKCPKCRRDENIKKVCRHCGHEYKYEPTTWYKKIIFTSVIVLILWVGITIALWLLENLVGDNKTLWEQIKLEWEWISLLKFW